MKPKAKNCQLVWYLYLYTYVLLYASIPGILFEGHGQNQEALNAAINAILLEPNHVPSKILMSALIHKIGSKALPAAARSMLSDALRIEPTNPMAWYYLGLIHKHDGRMGDAADCFQAASMLEEFDPIESFSTILWTFGIWNGWFCSLQWDLLYHYDFWLIHHLGSRRHNRNSFRNCFPIFEKKKIVITN